MEKQLSRFGYRPITATLAVLVVTGVLSGAATAQPSGQEDASLQVVAHLGSFAESVAQVSADTLMVATGDGLYEVELDASPGEIPVKLFEAESLGGIAVHGGKVYFNEGNSFPATFGSTLTGSIHSFDLATGQVDEVVSGIPAPNGLAILQDGTILYSTLWGGYEGVHKVGDDPSTLYVHVPMPNGLTVGPDGALYVGSTAGLQQVFKVDPNTLHVELTGVFTIFCDDLTVTASGIYAASITGIWAPGSLFPVLSMNLLGVTSIKAAWEPGVFFLTRMDGTVLRLRL